MDRVTQAHLARVRSLSEKDLQIYNMEVERQRKSVALAYVLWFFFGALGVHRFYLNQWLGAVNLFTFLFSVLTFSTMMESDATGLTITWFLCVAYLVLSLLVDLFTIPLQVHRANERIAQSVLAHLVGSEQQNGKPGHST